MTKFLTKFWSVYFQDYTDFLVYGKDDASKQAIRTALINTGFNRTLIESSWGPRRTDPFLAESTVHETGPANGFETIGIDPRNQAMTKLSSNLTLLDIAFRTYLIDYVASLVMG